MRSQLRLIPNTLAVVFVCLGLISCGGGGGDSGNSTSGGSTSGGSSGSAGQAVAECLQFVSGNTWGSVRSADIKLGGETAPNAMIQVIADAAVPSAPHSCRSTGPAWNSVQSLGANGLLGISNFAQDCGQACASQALSGYYYSCTGGSCSPIAVPVANQVWNPVAKFSVDNNGTVVSLPSVSSSGATQVNGTLTFGIGTQANNGVASATVLTVDSTYGEFSSSVNGTAYPGSFIDSGSNGLFYGINLFPNCNSFVGFYCPATPQAQSAVLQGQNGASAPVSFTVGNPDLLAATITVDAELAGPEVGGGVDWGLPLFFGRNIYTAIEGMSTPAGSGPWVGINSGSVTSGGTNQVPLVVDAGPSGANAINAPYVSVTLCAPGTTNCQTIDHVLVDTGSSGLRILASVLNAGLLAALPQSTTP
ncbi:MAG: DUF3443 family protein [Thiobacillaceae bacterium]